MYNDEFRRSVCETVTREKNKLDNTSGVLGWLSLGPSEAKDITGTINELIKVDPHEKELLYDPFESFDDVTGQTLDKRMAVEARKLEVQFFRNMTVYDKWRGQQQSRPVEPEPQSQGSRQGVQDRFSTGLVFRHPSMGVPADDLLQVCKQSGQTKSVQDNVCGRPKGVLPCQGHTASPRRGSHRGLRAG